MESRLFEKILLNEDNAMAYAINLHREMVKQNTIQKFNWKDFNKNRLENGNKLNDTKIVFGGGSDHKGQTTEPILANFIDEVVATWNNKFPNHKLNQENEKIIRQAATDYYVSRTGHK